MSMIIGRNTAGKRLDILIFVQPKILSPKPIIRRLPQQVMLAITASESKGLKKVAKMVIPP